MIGRRQLPLSSVAQVTERLSGHLVLLPIGKRPEDLTDDELESLLLAGEAESTPRYLLDLLKEYDRRAEEQ